MLEIMMQRATVSTAIGILTNIIMIMMVIIMIIRECAATLLLLDNTIMMMMVVVKTKMTMLVMINDRNH